MSIPFETTPDQVLELASIIKAMGNAELERSFIVAAFDLARVDQGVFDLMKLWFDASSEARDDIIADIQDSIDDYADAPPAPVQKPYIPFDQLDGIARDVTSFKARLRRIVEQHGGVSAVARKAGIPQPSLSRMLNSASMPRRATLYKIANALKLPETEIATEWFR